MSRAQVRGVKIGSKGIFGMAKNGLKDAHGAAGGNGQGGHGMAQAMQGNMRQTSASQSGGMSAREGLGRDVEHPAAEGAHILGAVIGGQLGKNGGRQGQIPEGSGAFERAGQIGPIHAQALAADMNDAGIGIKIGPLQAQGLTAAQATSGHEQQQGPGAALPGGQQIGGELLGIEDGGFGSNVRRFDARNHWRGRQIAQGHGLGKRRMQHGKDELRGTRMDAGLGIDGLLDGQAVEQIEITSKDRRREGRDSTPVARHGRWGADGYDECS